MRQSSVWSVIAILALVFLLLAIYFPAFGTTPEEPSPALRALADAERAFARSSVEKGMREAFLTHLAPNAVVFRPGPVNALEWFRGRPPVTGTLSWEPDFAAIAVSGDLGYTSGPWSYREPNATEGGTGHFVSVWRRQANGSFAVELDTGVPHPQVDGPVTLRYARPAELTHAQRAANVDTASVRAGLLDADRSAAREALNQSWNDVWLARAASDVRVYRPGQLPVIGKEAARTALSARPGALRWTPLAAGISKAGDLGYTYGTATFHPASAPADSIEASSYVRIWRTLPDGRYEIALDVAAPMPPPPRSSN
jgi:ketosteroid isomerase-like protein